MLSSTHSYKLSTQGLFFPAGIPNLFEVEIVLYLWTRT